jgi:hypothetical protein
MGFSSQSGSVAFRTQSVAATFPADFATAGIAMKLKTGALAANRDLLIPDPEIGGGRDVNDAFLGGVTFTGDYEFYARYEGIMTMLYAAFGFKADGPGGVDEKDTLTVTGAPTGGTFTLTYAAQTTAAIPWNATAAQIQTALINLSNIGPNEVRCTGGPFPGTGVVVNWQGTLSGTLTGAPMTATSAGLTGGTTPTVVVTRTTTGLSNTGTYNHLFVPVDSSTLPMLGIEENVGGGFDVYRYRDAVVNTLHLEADANGYLMGTAGMIARLQDAQASAVDVSGLYDNLDLVVGTNVSVSFGGVSLPAKSFNLDYTNNFESDDFRLGSFYIGDLTPKRRELTIGVSIREQDKTLWRQATYGSSVATAVGGLIQKQDVVITASTYSTIPGSSPALAYQMKWLMPYAALKPYALSVSGDDIMESDIEFQALRPVPTTPLCYVNVINGRATVA